MEALVINPDKKQIENWKKTYGDLYALTINEDGKSYKGIARKPDKMVLASAAVHMGSDPIKAGDVLRANCLLGITEGMLDSDERTVAVNTEIGKLFKVPAVEVEKI